MITAPHPAHRHHDTMVLPPSTPSPLAERVVSYHWVAERVVSYHWVAERGWSVELVTQPAQSPDLYISDLGIFASLKSRVWGMNAQFGRRVGGDYLPALRGV